MIRIMAKHPDGHWITSYNTSYTGETEKAYANVLVGMYRRILEDGMIMCFTIEIQTTIKNKNYIEVIASSGM